MSEDDERERDPFGRLDDAVGDRSGDPFDGLPDDRGESDETEDRIREVDAPAVRPGTPEAGDADSRGGGDPALESPGADVGERAPGRGDPFEDEGAFEQMSVGEIDEDRVWQEIADAQARGSVRDAGERDYAEVSKHRYCERCEHFTNPPEVGCTNEGTEILEFVDAETVRVVDCPVVAERRALRRGTESE